MPTPLPDQLQYLDSMLKELSTIPPEELNEDVDVSTLEAALRERVKGLSIREAQKRLNEDRAILERWLKSSGDTNTSGAWVFGVLSYRPGALVRSLLSPPKEVVSPQIHFEPPAGWTTERVPCSLNLRKGRKMMGAITVIDGSTLALLLRQNEMRDELQGRNLNPLPISGTCEKSAVRFGECHGHRFFRTQTAPVFWKSVQYLLEVPGGAVNIILAAGGNDFDESPFEAKIQTLRIRRPG